MRSQARLAPRPRRATHSPVPITRVMRRRLAPIATRTAISRWRSASRASSRPATFAQAIKRTNPAAACHNVRIGPRPMSIIPPASVYTRTCKPLFAAGCCLARRSPNTVISARASSSVRPAASRPIAVSERDTRSSAASGVKASGAHTWAPSGNSNPSGAMPTMSWATPSI